MTTLDRGLAWADARRSEALDLVRLFLGLGLFVRGVLFIADPEAYLGLLPEGGDGFFFSSFAAHAVALAHLGGGLLLAVGMLTRVAALVQIPVLVAATALHAVAGPLAGGQSFEFAALVLVLLVVFAVWGSGPLSLDRWLALRNEEAEAREARIVEETAERLPRRRRRLPCRRARVATTATTRTWRPGGSTACAGRSRSSAAPPAPPRASPSAAATAAASLRTPRTRR